MIPYIQFRKSGYYYRQAVPLVLQPVLAKREIVASLQTNNAKVAQARAIPLMASVYNLFERMRIMLDELDHSQAQKIAENWKRRTLNDDFDKRLAGTRSLTRRTSASVDELKVQLQQMDFVPHADFIDRVAGEYKLRLQSGSQSWRRLGYQVLKAKLDSMEEIERRDVDPDHGFDFLPSPEGDLAPEDYEKLRFSKIFEKWLNAAPRDPKTILDWRKTVSRFVELIGDKDIRQIGKQDIRSFREALKLVPKHSKRVHREMPLKELIKLAEKENMPRLHVVSVNKALSALSSILSIGIEEGHIEANPCTGMTLPVKKQSTSRRMPFNIRDLQTILVRSPVALGETQYQGQAGYWIPLLALFTGARLEELGQLLTDDVREEGSIWFLDFNALEGEKSLKTANSERRVPIHPELVRLGFIRYVEKMQRQRYKHLFPRLPHENDKCTAAFSKWFNRTLREVYSINDKRKVFHSFRHTFKDACRSAGIPVDVHDALTGHTDSSISSSYGLGHALPKLQEAMERIEYPGLKLVPLRTGR